ncbi:MAG: ABC transporter permease [Candidatus Bathyarchaeota archaeon]|nr:ABC transporter permease [Candidatus Bathyarchaeota archaeon]
MTARKVMYHVYVIARKDLTELFRNRLGLVMLILMPIFMMSMISFVFPSNQSLGKVTLAIANEDQVIGLTKGQVSTSGLIVTYLNRIDNFTITQLTSLDEVKGMIQRGEVEGGIVIPANFTASLKAGRQGTIIYVTDQTNPQMSAILQSAITAIFQQIGTAIAEQRVEALSPSTRNPLAVVQPLKVESKGAVAGDFSYFDFMAPGLIAMNVMMSVMTGLPAAISHEREIGTLDGLMVSPINRLSIILGKTFAQTIRGLLQGTLILAIAVMFFGLTIRGSLPLIFALLLLDVFSFVGIGIVITSFAKDQETATMMMMTIIFPMMFMSGVFFPTQQMPWYMQSFSKLIPLSYATSALRKVMVLGAGIPAITTEIAVLVAFGVIFTVIAIPTFKRNMTR